MIAWGRVLRIVLIVVFSLSIPFLLLLDAFQARKYTEVEKQVIDLEKKQEDLVNQNKKLITDISILSSSDRIEQIATMQLDMRKAETDEIVRVEMKDSKK